LFRQRHSLKMTVHTPHPPARCGLLRAVALAAAGAFVSAFGQTTALVADSPFAPARGGPGGAAAETQAYELAGSSVQGRDVLVCIFDRGAKRSSWIPVGGTSGPVHVVSFDQARDRAVVTISGDRRELSLRSAAVASSGGAVAERQPTPAAVRAAVAEAPVPAAATPAANPAREQQEARMLVSDLLEIGMQQRKAYQEARQKAAQAPQQPSN
jgi:hypothetical protein